MMKFMFILMLLMAAKMSIWMIPAAFGIWYVVKYVKRINDERTESAKDTTIYL